MILGTLNIRVRSLLQVVNGSLLLLSKADRRRVAVLISIDIMVSTADLLGLILIGIIASQAIALVSTGEIKIDDSINSLKFITNLNPEQIILIFGLVTALLLMGKTFFSATITKRTIGFLSKREAMLSSSYFELYLNARLHEKKKFTPQVIAGRAFAGANACITQSIGNAARLITEIFYLIIVLIGVTLIDWTVAVPAIIFYLIVSLSTTNRFSRVFKATGENIYSYGVTGAQLIEFSGSTFREIFVSHQQPYLKELFRENRLSNYKEVRRKTFLSILPKYIAEVTLVFGAFAMTGFQLLIKDFESTIGALAIFLVLSLRLIPAILRAQTAMLEIFAAMGPSQEFIQSLNSLSLASQDDEIQKVNVEHSKVESKPQILLRSVSVQFPDANTEVLSNLSLEIKKSEFIAITGPSGAGKSTLVDTILGIQEVSAGVVEIAGLNPRTFIQNYPNIIRYVPQNVNLLPATLRENLIWPHKLSFDLDDHLFSCLKLAELESFFNSLHQGFDTVINPRGANLSGGQKQRIGLARSLVANPQILFLDEATSSLDTRTETEISRKLYSNLKNITRVVIAHRISTIQSADRIIYLDEGKIMGQGSFSELINQVPAFRVAANASLQK
jgi:ABC-type multidrug transport system fused ATPase/permease subunit